MVKDDERHPKSSRQRNNRSKCLVGKSANDNTDNGIGGNIDIHYNQNNKRG